MCRRIARLVTCFRHFSPHTTLIVLHSQCSSQRTGPLALQAFTHIRWLREECYTNVQLGFCLAEASSYLLCCCCAERL
jgi:hypothetical protein